jgi:spore coat protein H
MPPLQGELPSYEITIAPETLAEFERRPGLAAQAATFSFQGKSQPVGLRLRGSSARSFPKRSWRIEFPEGVKFDGRRKHNLIAEYQDSTLMVEKLGYDLLRALGVPAPHARYVRLTINGVYQGVYLDLERVDKNFLDRHGFDDDDASIYRCGARDCELKPWRMPYQTEWDKKTNENVGQEDIHALEDAICHTPEPGLVRTLEERMELERYLRALVADALISNYVIQDSRSYFIHDRVTGRWSYVPWDVNNSVATWWPTYGLTMEPIVDHPIFNFRGSPGCMSCARPSRRACCPPSPTSTRASPSTRSCASAPCGSWSARSTRCSTRRCSTPGSSRCTPCCCPT